MIKIWSKRAKLRVNPVGQDFTFYSCKNYNKSKDANEKNQNNNKKQTPKPQQNNSGKVPLKVLPHSPAVQFSPDGKVSCDTLCFLCP